MMESSFDSHVSSENLHREMQLRRENESSLEIPNVGQDSSEKVTKVPDPIHLSGSLAQDETLEQQFQTPQPGIPLESVDNVDDAGLDSTREPDWEVVKPTQLPPEPGPSQFHNDKFWDERSLERELEEKDLQEEMIERETKTLIPLPKGVKTLAVQIQMKYSIHIIKVVQIHLNHLRRDIA